MLILPHALVHAIRHHAEHDYPEECCGVLLGEAHDGERTVVEVRACKNARAGSGNRYAIAPQDLIAAQREARESGLSIVGFYHSHPDHEAAPSTTDAAEAYWPECVYLIVSVGKGNAGAMNAFVRNSESEQR